VYALQTRSIPAGRARIALLFAATILSAQIRYTGTIDRDLKVVDGSWATFIFQSATESDFESLPSSADRKHLAHAGRLPETKNRFVITDSPVNGAIVYVDLNADGKYSTNEQFRFIAYPKMQPANSTHAAGQLRRRASTFQSRAKVSINFPCASNFTIRRIQSGRTVRVP
jgi:hypothetical protein